MQLFVLSSHCKTHLHCQLCRNLEGGRDFRKSFMSSYAVPGNEVDWKCPEGFEWNSNHAEKAEVEKPIAFVPPRRTRRALPRPTATPPSTPPPVSTAKGGCSSCRRNSTGK